MSDQPLTPPTPEERAAGVYRDNAFRDLSNAMNRIAGPMLGTSVGQFLVPGKPGEPPSAQTVMLHYAPNQLSDIVRQMQHAQKQMEIAVNVAIDQLTRRGHLNMVEFLRECGAVALRTESIMRRALLAQGTKDANTPPGLEPGGILRRN
jgi:hypothetical protein